VNQKKTLFILSPFARVELVFHSLLNLVVFSLFIKGTDKPSNCNPKVDLESETQYHCKFFAQKGKDNWF